MQGSGRPHGRPRIATADRLPGLLAQQASSGRPHGRPRIATRSPAPASPSSCRQRPSARAAEDRNGHHPCPATVARPQRPSARAAEDRNDDSTLTLARPRCSGRPHGRPRIATRRSQRGPFHPNGSGRPHGRPRIATIGVRIVRRLAVAAAVRTGGRGSQRTYARPSRDRAAAAASARATEDRNDTDPRAAKQAQRSSPRAAEDRNESRTGSSRSARRPRPSARTAEDSKGQGDRSRIEGRAVPSAKGRPRIATRGHPVTTSRYCSSRPQRRPGRSVLAVPFRSSGSPTGAARAPAEVRPGRCGGWPNGGCPGACGTRPRRSLRGRTDRQGPAPASASARWAAARWAAHCGRGSGPGRRCRDYQRPEDHRADCHECIAPAAHVVAIPHHRGDPPFDVPAASACHSRS